MASWQNGIIAVRALFLLASALLLTADRRLAAASAATSRRQAAQTTRTGADTGLLLAASAHLRLLLILLSLLRGLNTDMVFDVLNTPATINRILDDVPHLTLRHGAFECHTTVLHVDTDIADIDHLLLEQTFADQFAKALVRTGIVLWPLATAHDIALPPTHLLIAAGGGEL